MWRRDFHQAKLVTLLLDFIMLHQLIIGQELKITLDLAAVDPGKWIKPLKNQHQLGNDNIDSMSLFDMNLLMQQDLVVRFPVILFRVDKNIVAKRTRCFIAFDFNNPVSAINYDRVTICTPKKQSN